MKIGWEKSLRSELLSLDENYTRRTFVGIKLVLGIQFCALSSYQKLNFKNVSTIARRYGTFRQSEGGKNFPKWIQARPKLDAKLVLSLQFRYFRLCQSLTSR